MAKHPAAFINAIADEGTKAEAIEWLQKTWDELCDLRDSRLNLWRGECGHHWIRGEIDACPICKLATVAAAHYADSEKLLDQEIESVSRVLSSEVSEPVQDDAMGFDRVMPTDRRDK